ncbi:MAG: dihydroxyacetone kinase subunit DhaK [Actinomycetaceae bacterium]|nr:dihydroxyacetone kinase subunit DhaK [Actinomycetaceae bacterium]
MKKIINDPNNVVHDALLGFADAHPHLITVDLDSKSVIRANPNPDKVAIISGGGSGHEPLHSGYVGKGMLDGACCGEVFTSPEPQQMIDTAHACKSTKGVLFIIKNYTGDVMNFEMAQEILETEADFPVRSMIVDDDVAVKDSLYTAGRRGVGGTIFVEKIAGAAAEKGMSLQEVSDIAVKVNKASRSYGIALTSCTVPAAGKPTFQLEENEIELGIGIHGEPGRERASLCDATYLAEKIVTPILEDMDFLGEPVIALLNGMGGTPLLEQYILWGEISNRLRIAGVDVQRVLVGNYITSLEMAGASLSLCKADDQMLSLWDEPVSTVAMKWGN